MITIIESDSEFDALKAEWCNIDACGTVHVNQTYDWLRNGWDEQKAHHGGECLWIVKWSNGDDVAIFPFCINQAGELRFIFESHCDNLGEVCCLTGNQCVCYYELAQAILENSHIKRVCLHKLPLHTGIAHYLPILLRGCSVIKDNAYSWLDVAQSENAIASFKHMRSKDRADLKNIFRKAQSKTVKIFTHCNNDQFPDAEFRSLLDCMRTNGTRTAGFFSEPLVDFSRQMFDLSRLDIAVMYDQGGMPIALNFLLNKDGKYLSWIFLYSDVHASTELYVKLFDSLAKHGPFVFDFGVGAYSYKIGTFRPCISPTLGIFWGRSYWQYFLAMKEGLIRCLKDFVKARM